MKLFAVFEEGGLINDLPFAGWCSAIRCGVPIIGVRAGNWRVAYDRLMWGLCGCGPFRLDCPRHRQFVFPIRPKQKDQPHD